MKCLRGCDVPTKDGGVRRYEVGDTIDVDELAAKTVRSMVRQGIVEAEKKDEG